MVALGYVTKAFDALDFKRGLSTQPHRTQLLYEWVFVFSQRNEAFVFLGKCGDVLLLLLAKLHWHFDVKASQDIGELVVARKFLTNLFF